MEAEDNELPVVVLRSIYSSEVVDHPANFPILSFPSGIEAPRVPEELLLHGCEGVEMCTTQGVLYCKLREVLLRFSYTKGFAAWLYAE